MTPTDPLYASQWQYGLMGDIETIWDEYSGAGVHVGIYDDGVDYNHEDLDDNYDDSLLVVDDQGNPIDPYPVNFTPGDFSDAHGTSCAGLIAAENNGVGGIGVAWGSTFTTVNIFGEDVFGNVNGPEEEFFFVAAQATNFDISSNSWGSTPRYLDGLADGGFTQQLDEIYAANAENGRDGLGTITVQAAGNDDKDGNGDGTNASQYTITVAATDDVGNTTWYSNYGACILIAAPAAAVTTDLTGDAGYDPTNYTTEFGGTSAATPVTAGVIALMLDANEGLGWRDVQNILAASATLTGSEFDATEPWTDPDAVPVPSEEGLWQSNGSSDWNGGGYHTHTNYGYGMIDAYNAVRMAEVWTLFEAPQTTANQAVVSTGVNDFADIQVTDNDPAGEDITFVITDNIEVEHVALTLDLDSEAIGDLLITLTSADGTEVVVALDSGSNRNIDGSWVYGIDGLRGELSAGVWTVNVADLYADDTTTLRSASLDIYGADNSSDDVYHITDEYLAMLGFEPDRDTIFDTNGGFDWLNLAAIAGDVLLNMATAGTFGVDGDAWGNLSGTFENAVTGDGDDEVNGNGSNNEIHGMRGDDLLKGGRGNDKLMGGVDNDQLNGGSGNDTMLGETGNDMLIGGAGNDKFIIDATDSVSEVANGGTDTVKADFDYTLADNVEILFLTGNSAIDGTGNALANTMQGNEGANLLTGAKGNDTIIGNGGNDTLIGGSGLDVLTGNAGADTFRFVATLGSKNVDQITDFNVAADTMELDDAVFTGLALGQLGGRAFDLNSTGFARDADDRIIYENDTGFLFFDSDGTGAAGRIKIAELDTFLFLTNADFFVI